MYVHIYVYTYIKIYVLGDNDMRNKTAKTKSRNKTVDTSLK